MNDGSSVRLMKPGPAISAPATPSRSAASTTAWATSRGLRPSSLASGERAVGLGVGVVRRPHDRDRRPAGRRRRRTPAAAGRSSTSSGSAMGPPSVPRQTAGALTDAVASPPGRVRRRRARRQLDVDRALEPLVGPVDVGVVDGEVGRPPGELDRHHAVVEPQAVLDAASSSPRRRPRPRARRCIDRVEALAVEQLDLPPWRRAGCRCGTATSSAGGSPSPGARRRSARRRPCSCSARRRTASGSSTAARPTARRRASSSVNSANDSRNDAQCSRSSAWRSRSPDPLAGPSPRALDEIASSQPSRWWTPGSRRNGSVDASTRWS